MNRNSIFARDGFQDPPRSAMRTGLRPTIRNAGSPAREPFPVVEANMADVRQAISGSRIGGQRSVAIVVEPPSPTMRRRAGGSGLITLPLCQTIEDASPAPARWSRIVRRARSALIRREPRKCPFAPVAVDSWPRQERFASSPPVRRPNSARGRRDSRRRCRPRERCSRAFESPRPKLGDSTARVSPE